MEGIFQNKYRIESARYRGWDYSWNAMYFVTINTQKRGCFFGDICNRNMVLSGIGKIAQKFWLEIPIHFPFVKLDEFIIMPNHVHGIIVIDNGDKAMCRDVAMQRLYKRGLNNYINQFMSNISPSAGSLSTIVRSYKSAVKKFATINNINFSWQPRYHEHIIRNEYSLEKIRCYIRNNQYVWVDDEYYV